jgi:hypothetical protein
VEYLVNKIVIVCASRSVAGKRLVETENPSACATVNCNWCERGKQGGKTRETGRG